MMMTLAVAICPAMGPLDYFLGEGGRTLFCALQRWKVFVIASMTNDVHSSPNKECLGDY
jgi:hypothetical protein